MRPLPRKSIEPIALAAHVLPWTLNEHLNTHRCDYGEMGHALWEEHGEQHPHEIVIAFMQWAGYFTCEKTTTWVRLDPAMSPREWTRPFREVGEKFAYKHRRTH